MCKGEDLGVIQSICVTCKVRPGRLRPMGTEVQRPRLWAEGSAVPALPAGGASAQHFREKREMSHGKMMAEGVPLPTPHEQPGTPGLAGARRTVACCPSSVAGPAAGCMTAVVPARALTSLSRVP